MFAPHSIASGKQAKKKRAGDPARLSSSELDFIERLPRPAARLIARNKNDREVLVELDVHGAHLALGIVDLVDALFLLLDALGVLAAEVGESGGHLSHLGLRYLVVIVFGEGDGAAKSENEGNGKSFHHG